MSKDNKYHIGLCMAGAVSAGAYTAGVMDYLIEALEAWEKQKSKDPSVPKHDVIIDIIGGASAGGMTSIIAAVNLHRPIHPISAPHEIGKGNNPFFEAWVELADKKMMPLLLSNKDLINAKTVKSIFNSSFIDEVAKKMLQPFSPADLNRKYISSDLDVFVTLSNLVGVPYNLRFKANGDKGTSYKMVSYRDVAHFKFCGDYQGDGRINITGENDANFKTLRQSAMATGAFPFGLRYREVERDIKYLRDNEILYEIVGRGDVDWEKMKLICKGTDTYKTINADGGLMNNEPFEITMRMLRERAKKSEAEISNYKTTNASILMIDPFPSEDMEMKFEDNFGLGKLAGKVFGAMRGQLTFKEEDIREALDSDNASRYMVIPKRLSGKDKYEEGAKAIACGAFEGFSGFFEYDFRMHDYFLGRYNCRKFLHDVYTIQNPMDNPIFAAGYADEDTRKRYFITEKKDGKEIVHAPIIPLMDWDNYGNKLGEQHLEKWPQINPQTLKEMRKLFKKRYRKIFMKSADGNIMTKMLLWIGYEIVLGRLITNKTMDFIEKELKGHGLKK